MRVSLLLLTFNVFHFCLVYFLPIPMITKQLYKFVATSVIIIIRLLYRVLLKRVKECSKIQTCNRHDMWRILQRHKCTIA